MTHANVLFLTLKTFSLTGGIEKVCRGLAKVLNAHSNTRLNVFSLCDANSDVDERYLPTSKFKGFSGNKIKFGLTAFWKGLTFDTIILSHANLLFIPYLITRFKPKTRLILLAHGIEVWRELPHWKKKLLCHSVEIWAVSNYTAQVLQDLHGIPATRIKVLNNGLDPFIAVPKDYQKPATLLQRYQLQANQPVLFTLSRLASTELYKGYDLVIKALPALLKDEPNLKYILAGKADAKEQERLTHLIAKLQLQTQVILTGFLPDEELTAHFLLADAFVMPSRKEGFGIVFIEAAACGCAVIAGNQDGSTDALLNGQLGTLIKPDSIEEITKAIAATLSKPHNLLEREQRQALCLAHFCFEQYEKKVLHLLNLNIN